MKAKKETKPNQQQSEPETEENEELAGETQLSETSPEGATKLPLIPQYHIDHNQPPTTPQPPPTTQLFYAEAGGGGGGSTNPMHVIS